MRLIAGILSLLFLGSCSSPPAPPGVDDTHRRPANTKVAVDLQRCTGELDSARTRLAEVTRTSASARATLESLARNRSSECTATGYPRGITYTVLFPFASSRLAVSPSRMDELLQDARTAPLIVLRGRTDGTALNAADSRLARERAETVRTYLIANGVSAAQLRTTWQPVGDFAADNATLPGKALNRRVEIEIYRAVPRVVPLHHSAGSAAQEDPHG